MAGAVAGRLSEVAAQHWGMFTTAEAQREGIRRDHLTRMAQRGVIERLMQGVYRFTTTPPAEHELLYATWLALGGAESTPGEQPSVVVAGETAAILHGLGDFFPGRFDFVTPTRKGTRHPDVRLRVRRLQPRHVTFVGSLPVMSVERLIADLVEQWADDNQISRVLSDAVDQHRLLDLAGLEQLLAPLARPRGFPAGDGAALLSDLAAGAGITSLTAR